MTWGSPRASLYVKCVGTVRAASHPPVWIHRKCELRSLKKTLNGLCLDDDYTIAQWLEHRWLQVRVPGSSPGGDSQFFLQTFPICLFPSKPVNIIIIIIITVEIGYNDLGYNDKSSFATQFCCPRRLASPFCTL